MVFLTAAVLSLAPASWAKVDMPDDSSIGTFSAEQEKLADESMKKSINKKLIKSPRLIAYKAFRNGNTDLCSSSSNNKDCWEIVKSLTSQKKFAAGDCNSLSEFPNDFADSVDYCNAVKSNDCASLSGYKKMMCEAILNRDTNMMIRAVSDPDFFIFLPDKTAWAESTINIFYGFKTMSEKSCSRFTTRNLLRRGACNMLFGSGSFENRVHEFTDDIFWAAKAKKSSNKKLCNNIKNKQIADICADDAISDLNGIFDHAWL